MSVTQYGGYYFLHDGTGWTTDFETAQDVCDYLELNYPGQPISWNIRSR